MTDYMKSSSEMNKNRFFYISLYFIASFFILAVLFGVFRLTTPDIEFGECVIGRTHTMNASKIREMPEHDVRATINAYLLSGDLNILDYSAEDSISIESICYSNDINTIHINYGMKGYSRKNVTLDGFNITIIHDASEESEKRNKDAMTYFENAIVRFLQNHEEGETQSPQIETSLNDERVVLEATEKLKKNSP